jgi:hypothetical protein
MRGMKRVLIVLGLLVLIAALIVIGSQPVAPVPASTGAPGCPAFVVQVVRPWSARPLFGLLPGSELRFDQTSLGAKVGRVGADRLELSADGWEFVLQIDSEGKIAPDTHLVFPIELAERLRNLRGRPDADAAGYLRITTRKATGELDGQFLVEIARCEDVGTGKTLEWPPAPLTVRGSFTGLRPGAR